MNATERKDFNSYAATVARVKRIRSTWQNMKYRCYGSHVPVRTRRCYQDKGVSVCDEWRDNFEAFYDWSIENGYDDGLTIDRIDPDGDYCPANCRWITFAENRSRGGSRRAYSSVPYFGEQNELSSASDSGVSGNKRFCYANLEAARSSAGVTKKHLADLLNRSPQIVIDWKNGKSVPSEEQLNIVARALHVSVPYLRGDLGCAEATVFEKVISLCEARNISIARLEKECGLGNATVRGWEHSTPNLATAKKVADYFNCTVDELMEDWSSKKHEKLQLTDYGKRVKCRLIELNQTQKWLEASINERTGLYMDRSYLGKILTGQSASPKVIAAINEILGIERSE